MIEQRALGTFHNKNVLSCLGPKNSGKMDRKVRRIMATVAKKPADGKRLTQSQVIAALADQSDLNKKVVKEVLTNLSDLAIKETKKKGEFVFPGIGKLVRSDRKARMGRNPATGEPIKIPAKKVVKFRVSKATKDAIVPPLKKK